MKKILSLILALTLLSTCFASMSLLSVSAHQNFYDEVTFDEVDETNVTGFKYGTGNFTREEGANAKSIEKYTANGKFTNFHYSATSFVDVVSAPDTRYGKSLGVSHSFGTTNPYVQVNYTANKRLTGSIHLTTSLYVTESAQYIQRALLMRSNENSSYRKYPIMFDYGTNRRILIFEQDSGVKYQPNKWYDFDITYNMESMEYHVVVYEDGEVIIDRVGTDGGQKYSYCDIIIFYHGPIKDGYGDQYGYWDNLKVETVSRYENPKVGGSKEIFDFESFESQALGIPSTRGEWAFGYQGSTFLELVTAVTDEKTDNMELAPDFGKSIVFGILESYNADTAIDGKNDYLYPQLRYNFGKKLPDMFQFTFSLKPYTCGTIHLYAKGSNKFNPIRIDGTNLYVMNTRIADYPLSRDDWYDFDIKVDGATGYYDITVSNHTSPSQGSYKQSGYDDSIITYWDETSNLIYFQHSTGALKKDVYLDNIYFGELLKDDIPAISIDDVTATATADAEGTASCKLPFASAYTGLYIGARLTIEGSAPTVTLGDATIDVSALPAGTYPVIIKMLNGETPDVTVKVNGVDVPVTVATIPTSITLTSPAGEGNCVKVSDVRYTPINTLEIVSDKVLKNVDPADDVEFTFSNVLADFSLDNFKVYQPNGEIDDSALVNSIATLSDDGKTVTITFDKEKETHYHIAYTVKDSFGATLTDYAEVDTEYELYHNDGIRFYNSEGNEITNLTRGTVDAKVNIFSGDGVERSAYLWMGLYDEAGALTEAKFEPITFTKNEKEVFGSISVPDNGKAYRLKAGIMAANLMPIAYKETASQVIIFRLDDIKTSTYETYAELVSWAAEREVSLALGMVCNSIDEDNEAYIDAVKSMVNTGYVEIWCHGYDHTYHEGTGVTAEFTNQTPEYQAEILRKCYDHVYEKTDGVVKISSFATPSGALENNTLLALEMVPEYKVLMGGTSVAYTGDKFMNLTNSLWIESSTGVLHDIDKLKDFFDNRTVGEYMIYGGHGGYWDSTSIETFKSFVEYLRTKDVVFMTPVQYYNFVN